MDVPVPKPKNKTKIPGNGLPNLDILRHKTNQFEYTKELRKLMIGKIIRWGLVLAVLGWIYFSYFAYWNIPDKCFISVNPSWSQFNNGTVMKAIKLLKASQPYHYKELCSRVKKIDPNPIIGCGGYGGGCFWSGTNKTIYVGTAPGQVLATAGIIAHETCHQRQYDEHKSISEPECYAISDQIIYGHSMPHNY